VTELAPPGNSRMNILQMKLGNAGRKPSKS